MEVADLSKRIGSVRSNRPEEFCKKVFLEISQNSQENICAEVSFQRLFHTLMTNNNIFEKQPFN